MALSASGVWLRVWFTPRTWVFSYFAAGCYLRVTPPAYCLRAPFSARDTPRMRNDLQAWRLSYVGYSMSVLRCRRSAMTLNELTHAGRLHEWRFGARPVGAPRRRGRLMRLDQRQT